MQTFCLTERKWLLFCWDMKQWTSNNNHQIDNYNHYNIYFVTQKTFFDAHIISQYIYNVFEKFKIVFQKILKIIKFSWILCFLKFPWHISRSVWPISAGSVRTVKILLGIEKTSSHCLKLSFWGHLDPLNEFYGGKKPRGFLGKSL